MRQAINNLQSTHAGFGFINKDNVFKGLFLIPNILVCDMPHPHKIHEMITSCISGDVDKSVLLLHGLWTQGYSALDIVGTLFKVVKAFEMPEFLKLEFIKVSPPRARF